MSNAFNIGVTCFSRIQAKNIFWQVAGAVTIGTTAHLEGVVLAKTLIAVNTGASVNGRLLAQTAVAPQMNVVTQPAQ
jgi:hypothetical protein